MLSIDQGDGLEEYCDNKKLAVQPGIGSSIISSNCRRTGWRREAQHDRGIECRDNESVKNEKPSYKEVRLVEDDEVIQMMRFEERRGEEVVGQLGNEVMAFL